MRRVLASVAAGVAVALVVAVGALAPPAGAGSTPALLAAEPTTSVAVATDQPGAPLDFGLPPLLLTEPGVTGAGQRPTFAWEAVAGATANTLAVVTDTGEPLWAWQGPEPAVIIGGWPATPPPEAPGPLLLGASTCSSWRSTLPADRSPTACCDRSVRSRSSTLSNQWRSGPQ